MRVIIKLLLFYLCNFVVFASDSTIVFSNFDQEDILRLAKEENKSVMLYFHFDGCGACMKMENTTFKDYEVIDFFNRKFVNSEVNALKGDGIAIAKLYRTSLYPTFIFLDSTGTETHRLVGYFKPDEFLKHAKNALGSKNTLTNYKRLYEKGNTDSDFLYNYTYMLRNAQELNPKVVHEYLSAIDKSNYALEKNIKYIYEFCLHNFKVYIPYGSPPFSFMLNNKNLFYSYLDSGQVNTRVVWILNSAINKAIQEEDVETLRMAFQELEQYDEDKQYLFKEMDGRTTGAISILNKVLSSKLLYFEMVGDSAGYDEALNSYISKNWNDPDGLNRFAWGVVELAHKSDMDKIQTAIKCSVRSIELSNSYANNDTYAWLLYRFGENEKALMQAKKAKEIALVNNLDYSSTQELIELIEGK